MKTNSKIFWILYPAALLAAILVLPYALSLEKSIIEQSPLSLPVIVVISIVQSAIIFALVTFFGNLLAAKTGFQLPLLTAWLEKKKINYRSTAWLAIILGIAAGLAIILLDRNIFPIVAPSSLPSPALGFLASFYGGIGEEMLMRFFLLTLLVFIFSWLFRRPAQSGYIVWPMIIIVAVLFGLGHLPATAALVPITPFVVVRAIVLNGIGGVIFGWLYWRKGLEAAIISHFCADIVLHVLFPLATIYLIK